MNGTAKNTREGILFGLGNPLLDITADVDDDFLKKYGLEPNNAILAEDKHKEMYEDMCAKFNVEYTPGGATQNTLRVAQWLIGIPKASTFMGCVGHNDRFGKILEEKATADGINVRYQYSDSETTGTCAVLITDKGKNRSLCAYLGAANKFTLEHINKPENRELVERAKYYYISGFPLTVCPDAMLEVAKVANEHNRKFIMNLSAPFLCEFFKDQMMQVMPYVDILFGNETEAATFAKVHNFGTENLKEIALKLSSLPKQNGSRARLVIITQGSEPTIICDNGQVKEYPVNHIKPEEIVDTNGAGDAYVGGFLAELVQDRDLDECIRGANYAANYIIKTPGCTLPVKSRYSEHSACF